MRGQIRNNIIEYMLAGKSTITFLNEDSGRHLTYKIAKFDKTQDHQPLWFVKVLTGSDNEHDYSFIGTIRSNGKISYTHSRKSRVGVDAMSVKSLIYILTKLSTNSLPESIKSFHEGHCGRCGRKLTVPESIETGYGPECSKIRGIQL